MSTKSNRSSGTQHTQRGVNQGNVLVDPVSGLPISVVTDNQGKKRLAVDANISLDGANIDVTVDLDGVGPTGDTVAIVDNVTGNKQKIESDGSINANTEVDAADGDSIAIVGTEDGTPSGTQHTAKIGADGNLRVKDDAAISELQGINTKLANPLPLPADAATETTLAQVATSVDQVEAKLDSLLTELQQKTEPADAQNIRPLVSATDSVSVPGVATEDKQDDTISQLSDINDKLANPLPLPTGAATESKQDTAISVLESIDDKLDGPIPVTATFGDLNANKDDVAIAGTENGLSTGTIRHFVNNYRLQILASHDRSQQITYADFGTKDERITSIAYTSPTFPGITALKTVTYTLVGNKYRRDDIIWSIV